MNTQVPQVILGQQRYRVERFWGQLPQDVQLGLVSTLAVASDGSVLVAQRAGAPVIAFDAQGTFLAAWNDAEISDPHGINIDQNDRVLLVDRDAHEIQIRSLSGDEIATLGERHQPQFQAPFNHPTSAFTAPDGETYVADGYGNSTVHRFAADGAHLSTWGQPGSGSGEFSTPHSVWIDKSDRVLVADRENNRISVFDRQGQYLTSWTDFYHPLDITEDDDGFIYVSDQIPRLTKLDANGRTVGRCRPVWNTPHGVACGQDGMIYLTEMNPSSLTRLAPI
jgi:peptidylglycine monooxygenase